MTSTTTVWITAPEALAEIIRAHRDEEDGKFFHIILKFKDEQKEVEVAFNRNSSCYAQQALVEELAKKIEKDISKKVVLGDTIPAASPCRNPREYYRLGA